MKNKILSFIVCCCLLIPYCSQLHALIPPSSGKNVPMRTDADISRAVRSAFAADKFIATQSVGISVQIENGVATLSGNVPTERAKNEIAAKARGVGGVRQVVNNIQVQGTTPLPRSPSPTGAIK